MLDPLSLDAFAAIAREGNFVRAADQLGTVQSVVSKRLQRLEDRLGAPLFHRGGKSRVTLTRAGELFLPEAEKLLSALKAGERLGTRYARGEAGALRIGYVFSAALSGVLPSLLKRLTTDRPLISFEIVPMDTPSQLAALALGTLDITIVRPRPTYPEGVITRSVSREPVFAAMADTHRHADKPLLPPDALAGETVILPQFHEEVGLVDVLRQVSRAGGITMPQVIPARDFVSAASLASAGMGVALAPASLARLDLPGMVMRPIDVPGIHLELILAFRSDLPESLKAVLLCNQPTVR